MPLGTDGINEILVTGRAPSNTDWRSLMEYYSGSGGSTEEAQSTEGTTLTPEQEELLALKESTGLTWHEFENWLLQQPLTPQAQLAQDQNKAIDDFKTALQSYITTGNPARQAELEAAKQKMAGLGISRDQLESSGLYSGLLEGPTAREQIVDAFTSALDMGATGVEFLANKLGIPSDAISAILATVPAPGFNVVFGEQGNPPIVTGQTPTGTTVGVTDPYGIADIIDILSGEQSVFSTDAGEVLGRVLGGAGTIKSLTPDTAKEKEIETGVTLDTGIPTEDNQEVAPDTTAPTVEVSPDTTAPTIEVAPDTTAPTVEVAPDTTAPTIEVAPDITAPTVEVSPDTTVPTIEVAPDTIAPTAGGGGGITTPTETTSGVATISGGPGGTVDIDYLYDIFGDSIFAPTILDEKETDTRPYVYAKSGGMIDSNYDFVSEVLRLMRGQ